jgi:serine/threonine-protein kinase
LSPSNAAALTNHGTNVPAAYDSYIQGIGYLQRYEQPENVEIAIKLLQRSVEEDPGYAQAHAALGQAYWDKYYATSETQWAELAKSSVVKAQNLNSRLPEVQLAIGTLNRRTGAYLEAVSAFQRTLELDPGNVDAYIGLGLTYDSLGRTAEAEQAFHHAVDIAPTCWNCYNSLGVFLNKQARYGEAVQAWEKVTELTPDNVWGYMNIGAAYLSLGRFAEANESFRRGLKLAPDNADLYSNAGTVSFFQGHFEEAARYCVKAIELSPEKYEYWGNLADAYRMIPAERGKAAQNYRQAIRLAENALKVNATDANVLSTLARYYARTNDRKSAQEYLERAVKAKPDDVGVLLDASLVHLEGGKTQEALTWLEKAVRAGYPKELLVANPELADLHSDPEFERIRKEAKSYR